MSMHAPENKAYKINGSKKWHLMKCCGDMAGERKSHVYAHCGHNSRNKRNGYIIENDYDVPFENLCRECCIIKINGGNQK